MDNMLHISSSYDDISPRDFQKMVFIFNALQNGWEIKKKNNEYHFIKKHENKKEIYLASYLSDFLQKNMNIRM